VNGSSGARGASLSSTVDQTADAEMQPPVSRGGRTSILSPGLSVPSPSILRLGDQNHIGFRVEIAPAGEACDGIDRP